MLISRRSMVSGLVNTREIDVNEGDLLRLECSGGLIQDVFPHLSVDDREFLISGITPEEWTDLFGDGEE